MFCRNAIVMSFHQFMFWILTGVNCLSYNSTAFKTPTMQQAFSTNTTILFKWGKPPLPSDCQNLDFPTLSYVVDVTQSQQHVLSYVSCSYYNSLHATLIECVAGYGKVHLSCYQAEKVIICIVY